MHLYAPARYRSIEGVCEPPKQSVEGGGAGEEGLKRIRATAAGPVKIIIYVIKR